MGGAAAVAASDDPACRFGTAPFLTPIGRCAPKAVPSGTPADRGAEVTGSCYVLTSPPHRSALIYPFKPACSPFETSHRVTPTKGGRERQGGQAGERARMSGSSLRERTSEFAALVERLRRQQGLPAGGDRAHLHSHHQHTASAPAASSQHRSGGGAGAFGQSHPQDLGQHLGSAATASSAHDAPVGAGAPLPTPPCINRSPMALTD